MPKTASSTRRRRLYLVICVLTLLALSVLSVQGQTELVLVDGRVLKGERVRRDGGDYILTLESGDDISLPFELVESVRLASDRAREEKRAAERASNLHPGFRTGEPETIAGTPPPDGPTGLRSDGPQQLAGQPVRQPTRAEQTAVLGEPAEFQKNIIDPSWTPTTDWNMDPQEQNNWAPSKWAEDIVDHSWEPESAFDPNKDVMEPSRSTFKKSIIDSSWEPTDGFKK